ncbi:YncE family protein [Dyadobacter tibetensis]|uniref:YncE family protein n=1 Tax=Dyadobacter tibetensis TaxID=1211851 RepID=UPI0004702AAC|nr:DUF5074 domain-containing protein [Dyadobacter tibetensis]
MKKQILSIGALGTLLLGTWSCNQSEPKPKGDYAQGVFVINEGNFSSNNGSLSFFRREDATADADVFKTVNNVSLKGGIQGYAIAGEVGLILVDNSAASMDKIEIVDANTLESIATIGSPEIENPREVVAINGNKAYVSCWGATGNYPNFFISEGYVAVIDLTTNQVTKRIAVPKGVEEMVYINGMIYLGTVNYSGVNTLTMINTATNAIVKQVEMETSPRVVGMDDSGMLWVQAGLKFIQLDATSLQVLKTVAVSTDGSKSIGHPVMSKDKKSIYFTLSYYDANGVSLGQTYQYPVAATQVDLSKPLINRAFTGLGIDPQQGLIYGGITPSYAQGGYAIRYRADGSLVDSVKVGIAPSGFVFK